MQCDKKYFWRFIFAVVFGVAAGSALTAAETLAYGYAAYNYPSYDYPTYYYETYDAGYEYSPEEYVTEEDESEEPTEEELNAIPEQVVVTRISSDYCNQVSLSWEKVKSATHYAVFYRTEDSRWTKIATLPSEQLEYTHVTSGEYPLEIGKEYYYVVNAYNSRIKKWGEYDETGLSVLIRPDTVKLKSCIVNENDNPELEWEQAAGCTDYLIYRKKDSDAKWQKIGTTRVGEEIFVDKEAQPGEIVNYTVVSYHAEKDIRGQYDPAGLCAYILKTDPTAIDPHLSCRGFISDKSHAGYIDDRIIYYLSDSRVKKALEQKETIIMMFEGGSDHYPDSKYSLEDETPRNQAAAIAIRRVKGTDKIIYWNEESTTLPDLTQNEEIIPYVGNTTIFDGMYYAYKTMHDGEYPALTLSDLNKEKEFYSFYISRENPEGQAELCSEINLHTRTGMVTKPGPRVWSEGCLMIGETDSFSQFMQLFRSYRDKVGIVIVDRQLAKTGLVSLYGKKEAVEKLTAWSLHEKK